MFTKSLTLAKFLRNNLKLIPGDTIAIVLPNVPEYAIIIFGSAQAGLKITTVNPIYTPGKYTVPFTCISLKYILDEIAKQFINSEPRLVFTLPELWITIKASLKKLQGDNIPIVTIKHQVIAREHSYKCLFNHFPLQQSDTFPLGAIDFSEICEVKGDFQDISPMLTPEETLFLPYSGGTTGLPKGVELTHRNIVSNLCQMAAPLLRLNLDTEGNY